MSESLREALARLLKEAQKTVKHSEKCDLLTHYAEASSGSGFPIVWLRADCSCDYAQRVRERQAVVMEGAIQTVLLSAAARIEEWSRENQAVPALGLIPDPDPDWVKTHLAVIFARTVRLTDVAAALAAGQAHLQESPK